MKCQDGLVKGLFATAMVLLLLVVFFASPYGALAKEVTVRIALEEGRMADFGRYAAQEFKKINPNINVEIIGLPGVNMYENLLTAFTSGGYVYDGIAYIPGWGAGFVQSGWLIPLDQWWDESDPYYSDFLLVDMLSKYPGAPEKYSGTYYGLPFNTDVAMLLYRKDLYEEKGLKVPQTWEEFVKNCQILHDPENDFYGYGYPALATGTGNSNSIVLVHMWAQGCSLFDGLVPTFNTPENLAVFADLIETVPSISHPGLFETDYSEQNELFAAGKVAHIIQWMPAAVSTVEDPKSSQVAGKVGYARVYGVSTRGTGWATGVTSTSPNPDETYEFLKFMSGFDMAKDGVVLFSNSLVRQSLINDEELNEQLPWVAAAVDALQYAEDLPSIAEVPAIRDIIGVETIKALQGAISAEDALKNMDKQIYDLLDRAGYYR